jgi:hypothetical protein
MPDIPPNERLAKQICKALTPQPSAEASRDIISSFMQSAFDRNVKEAVELAVARQWLVVQDGTYFVTTAGMKVALRSRAGIQRKRRMLP